MKRRSKAGGKAVIKAGRRKSATPKRSISRKAAAGPRASLSSYDTDIARFIRERDEALEQQAATVEVLKVISASPGNLTPVFDAMLEKAMRLCKAAFGSLWTLNGDRFQPVAHHGVPAQYAEYLAREVPAAGPGTGRARLLAGAPFAHIVNLADDAPYREGEPHRRALVDLGGARTALLVPLRRDEAVIGFIMIYRQEVRPFTEKQIALIQNFAAQAVIAIENARLLNELRQRTDDLTESLDQQTATSEVLKVISSSPGELEPVFRAMLNNAVHICEAKAGNIYRWEGEALRLVTTHNTPPAFAEFLRRTPLRATANNPVGRMQKTKSLVHTTDLAAQRPYIEKSDTAIVAAVDLGECRTQLSVPLLKEDEFIGAITLWRDEVRPFEDKQIELVQNFAAQAVIAIENARLLSELRQRTDDLTESLEQQTATSEVLKIISTSAGELSAVFDAILKNAVRLCGAVIGNLALYDGREMKMAAMHNAPRAFEELRRRDPIIPRESMTWRVCETKKVVQIANLAEDERHTGTILVKVAGARTAVGVPMLKDDELVGVIVIYRTEIRPFADKQIELLSNFAAQAVIAIENTRLLSELQESLQQQTTTADVLKVISRSTFDLQAVFKALVDSAAQLCRATMANIALLKEDGFQYHAAYGFEADYMAYVRSHNLKADRGSVMGRAALEGRIIHIRDVLADAEYTSGPGSRWRLDAQKRASFRTALGVPLLREGKPIGAMFLTRATVEPFSQQQIDLVTTFAAQAVIAIENTRLLNELRESLQQQTATADVLKVISRSTFDLRTVLDTLVQSAARLCEANRAAISRQDGEYFRQAASYGYSPELDKFMLRNPVPSGRGSLSGRVMRDRKAVQIADVQSDSEYRVQEAARLGGLRTMLGVPLLREGNPIGVIVLSRTTVQPFTDKQIELVETFADQAVIAIENVRLFEAEQERTRELAKSLDELRATQDRLVQTEKLASLGQLTAGIAHEIKNPLNFVNNFSGLSTELIEELQDTLSGISVDPETSAELKDLTDTLRGNLEKVVQHGKRADAIVKSMLLHSGETSGEHRPTDINALVDESLTRAYYNARAEQRGFTVKLEKAFDPTAGEVDLFPREITRALLNLISNGFYAATKRNAEMKGGDHEPTLVAATQSLGDRVEIRIRDNGSGIPADVREKIFNPFFTTKPTGEGTGLGLSISHDIVVKQHGGLIEIDTVPGEFAEFRVILPRSPSR
jgi:GAF domain-containing protein